MNPVSSKRKKVKRLGVWFRGIILTYMWLGSILSNGGKGKKDRDITYEIWSEVVFLAEERILKVDYRSGVDYRFLIKEKESDLKYVIWN